MEKSEKYKKAEKEIEEIAPVFTLALLIGVFGSAYMQILGYDMIEGTGFLFYICVLVFIVFCFLYVRKCKKHNQVAGSTST